MREKLKKRTVSVVVFTLLFSLVAVSVNSYYTDHKSNMNVFTTGNVKVKICEPEYERPENVKKRDRLAPGEEVQKDPYIYNCGKSECFVFAEVRIPRSKRIFTDSDGKKLPVMERNLFEFICNSGWSLYSSKINDSASEPYESYIFSYSDGKNMKALRPGGKTTNLFKNDRLKFADVIETHTNERYEIPVTAYAIQTSDVLNSKGSISVQKAYMALFNQKNAEGK